MPKPALKVVQATPRKPTVAERVRHEPDLAQLRLGDVIRLMGDSAANGDKNDPVVFTGTVEAQMRQVIARYGFERLPLTYGELYGLLDYCEELDSATGAFMPVAADQLLWQKSSFKTWRKHSPHLMPAIELYAAKDVRGLHDLHRREDTLARLGREFREFDERE